MKSNYKLKLITALVVLGFSVANANALLPTLTPTTISAENSDEWVMVQNENGIKVFYTNYLLDGNSYLKIRFKNLTNENLRFEWSLTNKDAKVLIDKYVNQVEANKSIDFVDSTMPIFINNGESVNDFSINLNIK